MGVKCKSMGCGIKLPEFTHLLTGWIAGICPVTEGPKKSALFPLILKLALMLPDPVVIGPREYT